MITIYDLLEVDEKASKEALRILKSTDTEAEVQGVSCLVAVK